MPCEAGLGPSNAWACYQRMPVRKNRIMKPATNAATMNPTKYQIGSMGGLSLYSFTPPRLDLARTGCNLVNPDAFL
jgi:hypothetical protein